MDMQPHSGKVSNIRQADIPFDKTNLSPPEGIEYLSPTSVGERNHGGNLDTNCRIAKENVVSEGGFSFSLLSIPLAIDKFKFLKAAPKAVQPMISTVDGFEGSELPDNETPRLPADDWSGRQAALEDATLTLGKEYVRLVEQFDEVMNMVWSGQLRQAWEPLGRVSTKAFYLQRRRRHSMERDLSKKWFQILELQIHLGLMLGEPAPVFPQVSQVELTSFNLWSDHEWVVPVMQLLHKEAQQVLVLESMQSTATEHFVNAAASILSNSTFVQVAYCITEDHTTEARILQMTVHLVFLLIRCCFAEIAQHDLTLNVNMMSTASHDQIFHKRRSKLSHSRLALKSARFITTIFRQIFRHDAIHSNLWMQCHAVWIASALLGIGKLRNEVDWHDTSEKLGFVAQTFHALSRQHDGCHLFGSATPKLSSLNLLPQTNTSKKRQVNAADELIEPADTKRQRKSFSHLSTPVRPSNVELISNLSSSSDLVPGRLNMNDSAQALQMSYNTNASIPITPIYVPPQTFPLPAHQMAFGWPRGKFTPLSPQIENINEQTAFTPHPHMMYDQYENATLSSPIRLFRHVRTKADKYETMAATDL